MQKKINKLIFDLDGTLVDTAHDITMAVNQALEAMSLPSRKPEELRHHVGSGLGAMFSHAIKLGEQNATKDQDITSDEEIDKLIKFYSQSMIDYYHENISIHSRMFPRMEEFLDQAKKNGLRLAICSNKPEYLCVKLCKDLGIDHYFELIIGGDSTGKSKPDPKPLLTCLHHLGCNMGEYDDAIMIGDSDTDYFTAVNCNVNIAIMTKGFGPFEFIDPITKKVNVSDDQIYNKEQSKSEDSKYPQPVWLENIFDLKLF